MNLHVFFLLSLLQPCSSLLPVVLHPQSSGKLVGHDRLVYKWEDTSLAQLYADTLERSIVKLPSDLFNMNQSVDPSRVIGVTMNSQGDQRALLLATSVASIGCLTVILCFCILRRCNPVMYMRVSKREQEARGESIDETEGESFSQLVEAQISVPGYCDWISQVWNTTPEEEVAAAGLDGWAFLEFYRLNTRILIYMGLPLLLIMGGVRFYASQQIAYIDLLARFDIASVTVENKVCFWAHSAAVWYVVILIGWFIVSAHEDFTERRYEWLKAIPVPRATTVMVKNIPQMYRSDQALKDYFSNLFSEAAVERAYIVRKTGKLPRKVQQLEAARYALALAKKAWERAGCPSTDTAAGAYFSACELLREKRAEQVAQAQAEIEEAVIRLDPAVCSSAGFVTFTSELAQRLASREQYRRDVTEFVLAMPPDPSDVIYKHLAEDEFGSTAWEWVALFCLFALFILWAPVVVLISSVTTISSLEGIAPVLKEIMDSSPSMQAVVTGLLSTVALKLFMSLLPNILLNIIERFTILKAGADAQLRLHSWYTTFLLLFVLLVTALGRGITSTIELVAAQPSEIIVILANTLPYSSHFYFSYTVLCCFTVVLEILRVWNLVKYFFYRLFLKFPALAAKRYSEPEDQAFYGMGSRFSLAVLMSAIAIVFCTCSPLIILFAVPYFLLGQMTYGYLLVFAESKKPDLGGAFWMQSLQQMFLILFLYIIFMVGVLLAKWDGQWIGPPGLAALSLLALYYSWRRVNNLAFESLPLEEVVKASRAKQAEVVRKHKRYIQPECDPDLTLEDLKDDVS